jgi:signal transduction histidine kinase
MRSLGARLFTAALISLAIALILTWLALTRLFADYVSDGYERELQALADTIVANLGVADGALILRREPTDPRFEIAGGGRYWQVDGSANYSKRSRSLWHIKIITNKKLIYGSKLALAGGPSGGQLLVLTQEAILERNGRDYKAIVQVAADGKEYDAALASFRSRISNMLQLTGLFLLSAAGLQIFVGLRPLFAVRKAVYALRRGHIAQIDTKGPQEVRPLIAEINTLMTDNRLAVEHARTRASDLAHGLKTPLTILGQISESLSKQGDKINARKIASQVATIGSRVDRQLALARSGNPDNSVLDCAITLNRLIKATKPLADAAGIGVIVDIPAGLFIAVDSTDFLEATGNILDNAVRHARLRVFISAKQMDTMISIDISDDGPGIAQASGSTALERGRRLGESGEGSGLGLTISSEIVSAYGGSISLGQSDIGGLAVRLDWPAKLLSCGFDDSNIRLRRGV